MRKRDVRDVVSQNYDLATDWILGVKFKDDARNSGMIMFQTEVGNKSNLICRMKISLLDVLICYQNIQIESHAFSDATARQAQETAQDWRNKEMIVERLQIKEITRKTQQLKREPLFHTEVNKRKAK